MVYLAFTYLLQLYTRDNVDTFSSLTMTEVSTSQKPDNFFPAIGSIAEKTHAQEDGQINGEDEDQAVQEIESLCMTCHEQVSVLTDSTRFVALDLL
jgi:hypothetical protein